MAAKIKLLHALVNSYDIYIVFRLVVVGFLAVYIAAVVAFSLELRDNNIYFAYICVFNFLLLLLLGKYMIRSILFPYSNYFIRSQLDSVINQRFSQEFGRLLQQVHKCLRIMSEQDEPETFAEFKKKQAEAAEKGDNTMVGSDAQVPITSDQIVSANLMGDNSTSSKGSRDRKRHIIEIN